MKKLALLLFAAFATFTSQAQTSFAKGDNVLGLNIGFGGNVYGSGYTSKIPLISLKYEYCIKDNLFDAKSAIGIGAMVGYTSAKYAPLGWGWKYTNVILGVRGALHYQFVNRLDTYAGLMLGYDVVSTKEIGTVGAGFSSNGSSFTWNFYIGGRYWFTNRLAAMAEIGAGVSILDVGIAYKF